MFKRELAGLLAAVLCFSAALPVFAETDKTDGTKGENGALSQLADAGNTGNYSRYMAENKSLIGKGERTDINIAAGLAQNDAQITDNCLMGADGIASWQFDVAKDGAYRLFITYKPDENTSDSAELAVKIDGDYPFDEAKSVFLPILFENDGGLRHDDDGNEFAPMVKKINEQNTECISDPSGYSTDPFCFALTSGTHTLTLESKSQPFEISEIYFDAVKKETDYKEYLKAHSDAKDYKGEAITVEGESATVRSKKSIVPMSDNSGASVYPKNAFTSKINYIGSKNWNRPGDTVTWEVDVKESGFYAIGFNYRQNYTMNETFYRVLKIDGEIPFEQAKKVGFSYSGSWKGIFFADGGKNPYKIYLEKGKHTVSLSVTMGELSQVCGRLDSLVYELAGFYRSMVMITGENPDANRDYSLFTQIENYNGRLESYIKELDTLLDMLYKITGSNSGTAPTNLRNMKDVLERMRDNKYYAHQYKDRYYSNYAAVSAWACECSSMPLDIDAIFLASGSDKDILERAGFLSKVGFSVKRFASSFVSQYINNGKGGGDKSITIWINWGRDQAKVLKSLVSSSFTAETGIKVNVRVTNATLLQGILSGNGPDCSIQVSRSEPVNLAMRGGLYNLKQFDDFDEVMKRFMPGAGVPYEYKGGSYGVPNTQSFYMLFYRTDIFGQMGLSVPNTWDEFFNLSNMFMRKNMQVGLPYTQITDMTQVNNGVGALNIFPTLLTQNGISLYNEDYTATTLTQPETVKTFVEWTNCYNKYGFPKTYDFYNRFRIGLMPMAVATYTMYATLTAAAPEISQFWSMAEIPGVLQEDGSINRSASGGGSAAIILKASKKPELAWQFIKWWTGEDTQYSYASEVENILGTSARYDTANVEALKKLDWDKNDLAALISQWQNVKEIPEVPGGYYLSRVIDQAFWNTTNGEDPYEMTAKWGLIANNEIARKEGQYGN